MARRHRKPATRREAALVAIIEQLATDVEQLGCTCPSEPEEYNRMHCQPGRRRKDSRCGGVALAVRAELRMRRALRLPKE
jgi:hypothetical protein